jgi:hypothetical protein
VDGADAGVSGNYFDGGLSAGHAWVDGDLDGDGKIGNSDAGVFGNAFGQGTAGNPFPRL